MSALNKGHSSSILLVQECWGETRYYLPGKPGMGDGG